MRDLGIVPKPGFYVMTYHCSNCGETFTQLFKKGERASQGVCTNCGVEPDNVKRWEVELET